MPAETASDRAAFFAASDFATAATYTPLAGGAVSIDGIYDDEFVAVEAGINVAIGMSEPKFMCRSTDLPTGAGEGDQVIIDGVPHTVRVVQPDGTGITTLILDKE